MDEKYKKIIMIKKKVGGQEKPYKTKVKGIRVPVVLIPKINALIVKHIKPVIDKYKENQ